MLAVFDPAQEQIFDRYKNPQHAGQLKGAHLIAEGANQVCGDEIHLEARVEGGRIIELKHQCRACAIASAAADLLAERVKGKEIGKIAEIEPEEITAELGIPLSPIRVKCALLPLETLKQHLPNS